MSRPPLVVLLAEDNEHDIVVIKRAWQEMVGAQLYIVSDGEACLDYLYRRGTYSAPGAAPRPDLLIMDLNMPKIDGLTVLKHIREDAALRRLPVVILTTSRLAADRIRSYDLGANAYIRKPSGYAPLAEALRMIHQFWTLAEPPE
jgi:CheY-like chemotaxis protein